MYAGALVLAEGLQDLRLMRENIATFLKALAEATARRGP
jgi:hypothetical protein